MGLPTISPSDLAEANLLEATREYARWQNDSECVEQNGLLLIAGSTPFPAKTR